MGRQGAAFSTAMEYATAELASLRAIRAVNNDSLVDLRRDPHRQGATGACALLASRLFGSACPPSGFAQPKAGRMVEGVWNFYLYKVLQ
jgi:hypothetical protein